MHMFVKIKQYISQLTHLLALTLCFQEDKGMAQELVKEGEN